MPTSLIIFLIDFEIHSLIIRKFASAQKDIFLCAVEVRFVVVLVDV